jgi:hypothetical protein
LKPGGKNTDPAPLQHNVQRRFAAAPDRMIVAKPKAALSDIATDEYAEYVRENVE